MTGFFRRLFRTPEPVSQVITPNDRQLTRAIDEASENHKRATLGLKQASIQQMEDAEYIRETLQGVLSRIEGRRAHQNG